MALACTSALPRFRDGEERPVVVTSLQIEADRNHSIGVRPNLKLAEEAGLSSALVARSSSMENQYTSDLTFGRW